VTFFARAVFVLLVGATFFAFFAAQRLKSAPPVAQLAATKRYFSPNADGRRDALTFRVRLQDADDVTLTVIDSKGNEVRRIANAVPADPDRLLQATWDGRTNTGRRAPDGRYLLRVNLRKAGRAVRLHPGVYLDTVAPRPAVFAGGPANRWITGPVAGRVAYRVRGVASRRPTGITIVRTDGGPPRAVARATLAPGVRRGVWNGKAGGAPAPAGTYMVVATVRDTAGNVGRSAPADPEPGTVAGRPGISVRRLLAGPPVDPVRAGGSARFEVDSRGRPFVWSVRRIGGSRVVSRGRKRGGGVLTVRAPDASSGVYVLAVRAGSDIRQVPFAVQDAEPAPILVVLPAVTWFGRDELDDDRDGLPNTLLNGGPADYPRLLASGLPDGFADQIAPLLVFLDRQHIAYDVTTDLTLAASRRGLAQERSGVLLPGPLQWVTTGLAGRLRRYVDGGGRLAMFGADSLRRGVDIGRDRLLRPLPPTAGDPFGTRLRPLRRQPPGAEPLQPTADEGATGLLTGVETLPGFTVLEESEGTEKVRAALAAVDTKAQDKAEAASEPLPKSYPVLELARVGKGFVIRVGLPEWGSRLAAGQPEVQQLTRNIADLIRGYKPKLHSY
jgi:flagellar hook assembly protein FlgD